MGLLVYTVRMACIHGPRGGSLACNAGVRGLVLLGGFLYVLQVGRTSTDIAVFDTASSSSSSKSLKTVLRRLTVPGLCDASDMAACIRHRCLYVADVGSDNVHRLSCLESTVSFQCWPVGDKPWGLSASSVSTTKSSLWQIYELKPRGAPIFSTNFPSVSH